MLPVSALLGGIFVVWVDVAARMRSKYGEMDIDVPQDRESTFEPKIVRKRQKDISGIEDKIIAMYAKGLTTRQISEPRSMGSYQLCMRAGCHRKKQSLVKSKYTPFYKGALDMPFAFFYIVTKGLLGVSWPNKPH